MSELLPFPGQPADVAWPTEAWPTGEPADAARVHDLVEALFVDPAPEQFGHTNVLLVVHEGRLVVERYGTWRVRELEALAGKQPGPVLATDRLLSWSMAKSVTHLAVGIAVGDDALAIADRPPVPEWSDPSDPRGAITWDDLLAMRPGLQWTEEYYEFAGDELPDVITMLYGEGQADMAAFAAGFPLVTEPGSPEAYNYSSGTTNIVAAALQRTLGLDEAGMRQFLEERLFAPIGITGADPRFDAAGTFVGSSYLYLTSQDWARFGLLALRGGEWDGTPIVPH
ncbi:MAG TPA: serine hydrolase, partial [Acidimicrobiales bacterium]